MRRLRTWMRSPPAGCGKHNNYEGATHTLLLCALPGQKTAGQSTRGIVEYVDIYPTLSELCGLPQPKWKKAVFSEYPKGGPDADGNQAGYHGITMRTERWRYVEWVDKRTGKISARELYDHHGDPQENENLAARPAGVPSN